MRINGHLIETKHAPASNCDGYAPAIGKFLALAFALALDHRGGLAWCPCYRAADGRVRRATALCPQCADSCQCAARRTRE
jgi:hypothetical protein